MKMRHVAVQLFLVLLTLLITDECVMAQDNVRGSREPIVSSIDASKLSYDILVDGNLDRDDSLHLEATITPNRFGGAGVFWPGGSTNTYSRFDITYSGN
jgi:hypothetical protein